MLYPASLTPQDFTYQQGGASVQGANSIGNLTQQDVQQGVLQGITNYQNATGIK
jgi:hypothetical protein